MQRQMPTHENEEPDQHLEDRPRWVREGSTDNTVVVRATEESYRPSTHDVAFLIHLDSDE